MDVTDGTLPPDPKAGWPRVVRSNARKASWGMWVFAGLWNLLSTPVLFFIPGEVTSGNLPALAGLLFPLVGIYLAGLAWRISREWRRYGSTPLTLDPYPGSIGGQIGGSVELPAACAGQPFEVTLACVHSYVSGSGKNRSRREKIRWEAGGPACADSHTPGARLSFCFDVPQGLPASEPSSSNHHLWRVHLTGGDPHRPLDRTFEIAAFPDIQQARHVTVNTGERGRNRAAGAVASALLDEVAAAGLRRRLGLSIEQREGWLRLYFHRGRLKGMAAGMLVAGALFTGVGLWLPDAGFGTGIMRTVFGLFGLGLLGGALYLPLNTLDVRVSPGEIIRIRTWLGLVIRRQTLLPASLNALNIEEGASSNNGTRTTVYYRLTGSGPDGDFCFAEGIPDRALVEALAGQIRRCTGISG